MCFQHAELFLQMLKLKLSLRPVSQRILPKNPAEVRSFLGVVNFTARFIPDLSTVSAPLRQLTKNGEPFVWDQEEQQSFDELKKRLASAEILGYFDKNAQTKVIADASPVGLGAVLVQEQGEEL